MPKTCLLFLALVAACGKDYPTAPKPKPVTGCVLADTIRAVVDGRPIEIIVTASYTHCPKVPRA